jgi:hypothetical protein
MTLNISAQSNQPPNFKLGRLLLQLNYNELYTFTYNNFYLDTIPPYGDPENDPLENVKIIQLPTQTTNTLTINSIPAIVGDIVTKIQLDAGQLQYQADVAETAGYDDGFKFTASDTGSSTYSDGSGKVMITVGSTTNSPPSAVGDGSATIPYAATLTFTRAMFTTLTTPAYSDPEGDPALFLKVTGLPVLGEILLNSIAISLDQVIDFNDIDAGLLEYVPDLLDDDGDVQGFTFEIADISGTFVG